MKTNAKSEPLFYIKDRVMDNVQNYDSYNIMNPVLHEVPNQILAIPVNTSWHKITGK
jgi:hypothetical protein